MKYKEVMYFDKLGYDFRYWDKLKDLVICKFRYDPIPSSGSQWWQPRANRYGKTAQELRKSFVDVEYVRGKRRKMYLQSDPYWDGYYRSDHRDNSWKKSTKRKHQWKSK